MRNTTPNNFVYPSEGIDKGKEIHSYILSFFNKAERSNNESY